MQQSINVYRPPIKQQFKTALCKNAFLKGAACVDDKQRGS